MITRHKRILLGLTLVLASLCSMAQQKPVEIHDTLVPETSNVK